MGRILRVIDRISLYSGKLSGIPLFLVVFVVLYEVIARYLFNTPTQWANELMLMGCAFVYLTGGAWVLSKDEHVRVELLYDRLSERGKAVLDASTFFFFFLYVVMLLWFSGKLAWESLLLRETSGSSWDPPLYPIKIIFTLGVFVLVLQGLAKFVRDLLFIIRGKRL